MIFAALEHWVAGVIGASGTALLGMMTWIGKFYLARRKQKAAEKTKERKQTKEESQDEQVFFREEYRKLVSDVKKMRDEVQNEFDEYRHNATEEIHSLRDDLQKHLLRESILEERLKSCSVDDCPIRTKIT